MSDRAVHQLPPEVNEIVERALEEDVGSGDLTAALIPENVNARARVLVREEAILCGQAWFDNVYAKLDERIAVEWLHHDGDQIKVDQIICVLQGPARAMLSGERVALNFLQTLSGTATVTREYSSQLAGTAAKLLDTRKTVPGLRRAQKYAVRCGGGYNHRQGLFDGILIKENHIAAAGSIAVAVSEARQARTGTAVEVEVESMSELDEALDAGADILLLDNFSISELEQAVEHTAGRARLEASGGIDKSSLRRVAQTGVDFVSVGAITKHLRAIDMTMLIDYSTA